MKVLFRSIEKFLSEAIASRIVVFCCVAGKIPVIFFYNYTGRDKIYSLSASYNLLHGKGWTNSSYSLSNLDTEILQPFCHWPPGYGLLLTPFQAIFRENIYLSTALLESIFFILFVFLCRGILATQKLSRGWINISTIFLSFFSHDFIENSLGTDLPALVFLLAAFYFSIRLWQNASHMPVKRTGFIIGISLFFTGFIRYMYVPVGIFIALLMLMLCQWKKNQAARPGFVIAAFTTIAGLAAAMIFQDNACGSPFYTGIHEKGIFWNHLSYWHPATVAAVADLNFMPVQLSGFAGISFTGWLYIFNVINLFVYAWIVFIAIKFFSKYLPKRDSELPWFEALGLLITGSIIGELAILSLTNGLKYTISGESWTFIVEGRYHAFPVVFFQLFLLKKVSAVTTSAWINIKKIYRFALIICMTVWIVNSLHQIYYTVKVTGNFREMKAGVSREKDYVYFEKLLKETRDNNPGTRILVASDDQYYTFLATMLNAKGIHSVESLNQPLPEVSETTLLITAIHNNNLGKLKTYFDNNKAELIHEVAGTRFYFQSIQPKPAN